MCRLRVAPARLPPGRAARGIAGIGFIVEGDLVLRLEAAVAAGRGRGSEVCDLGLGEASVTSFSAWARPRSLQSAQALFPRLS